MKIKKKTGTTQTDLGLDTYANIVNIKSVSVWYLYVLCNT